MKLIIWSIILAQLSGSTPDDITAITTKVVGNVMREGDIRSGQLQKGFTIYSGDKITVGPNSFISYLNVADRSVVKVYDNSIIKILFKKTDQSSETDVALFYGRISAELEKTDKNTFKLIMPVAIASVKGTHFLSEHRPEKHLGPHNSGTADCVFSVIEGELEIENTHSGKTLFLEEGKTVIATPDGNFKIFKTTDEFIMHYKEPN